MAKRTAGERLRRQARRRHVELAREQWWRLLLLLGRFVLVAAVLGILITAFLGRSWGLLAVGAVFGAGLWAVPVLFTVIDPRGAHLQTGLNGEIWTAQELAKARWHGWRAVHNVNLAAGDIDHVVVGPGGVIVIETKNSNADWSFLKREEVVDRWARQAQRAAFRTEKLVLQHTGIAVDVRAYLVAWSPGQPDAPGRLGNGVVRIRGGQLAAHLRELPKVLERDDVVAIARSLNDAAEAFDRRQGLSQTGFRRLLPSWA